MRNEIFAVALAAFAAVSTWWDDVPTVAREPVRPPPSLVRGEPVTRSVVLVTIDGVRPFEVFRGVDPALAGDMARMTAAELVPTLHHLATHEGVGIGDPGRGAPFVVSGVNHVSLPGYLELMTGRPPDGCTSNACRPKLGPTLFDAFRNHFDLPPSKLAVFASWGSIRRVATSKRRRSVVSAGRRPVRASALAAVPPQTRRTIQAAPADASPGHDDYRADAHTARAALQFFDEARPRFLWLALGDTDEHAHRGDYAAYLEALRRADDVLRNLVEAVNASPDGAATTIVVTTDHGRSKQFASHGVEPESAPIWLVAAGGAVPRRGIVALSETRALADVAPTIAALVEMAPRAERVVEPMLPDRPPQ